MAYSLSDIKKIQQLAQNADLKNALLAYELIKVQGMLPEFETSVYWIYNQLIWEGDNETAQEIHDFLLVYLSKHHKVEKIFPLLEEPAITLKKTLHPHVEKQALLFGLDLPLIGQLFYEYWGLTTGSINKLLFKYGNSNLQEKVLPSFKTKEHTGRSLLDLGGLKLTKLPDVLLKEKNIQGLKIWGNDLDELPDFWEHFRLLELLNIADNNLKELPPSFLKLTKLQKLYAQNNSFDVGCIITTIKKLPQLNYLTIASIVDSFSSYNPSENNMLKQVEELVHHNKIHATDKEQQLILALYLEDEAALRNLTLLDFFDALSDTNEETRIRAKTKILNWKGTLFNGVLPANASVAVLGIVSFATRTKINQPQEHNIQFTAEISKKTTHLLIGDFPENYEAVKDRSFVFITEADL